jgi:hypothetical protein
LADNPGSPTKTTPNNFLPGRRLFQLQGCFIKASRLESIEVGKPQTTLRHAAKLKIQFKPVTAKKHAANRSKPCSPGTTLKSEPTVAPVVRHE